MAQGPEFDTAQSRFWRKKHSSQLTLIDPARLFGTPGPSLKTLDLVDEHQSRLLPPLATTIPGNRKNFTSGEIPANSGNFLEPQKTSRNFRGFGEGAGERPDDGRPGPAGRPPERADRTEGRPRPLVSATT